MNDFKTFKGGAIYTKMSQVPPKICIMGNPCIGKSKTIKEVIAILANKEIENTHDYKPTLGVEVHSLRNGNIGVNIWDIAGNDHYLGLGDAYLINCDECWIIRSFDGEDVTKWHSMFTKVVQNDTLGLCRVIEINDFKDELLTKLQVSAGY